MTAIILEAPATLSRSLQDIARSYLAAQKRSGDALLEAASWLAKARAEAQHGEWGIFLVATRTSESTAKRLLDIHARAEADPQFAEAIRSDWIGATVAGELAQPSIAPEVRQRLLEQETPPTKADVSRAKGTGKSATVAEMDSPAPALTINGVPHPHPMAGLPPPFWLESATVAEMDATAGAWTWGQTHPDALESHQWRRAESGGYWESRCEKTTQGKPAPPTAARRCLICAATAPRMCAVEGCDQESIGKENIAGWAEQRCLAHRDQALQEQQEDEARASYPDMARLRAVCERAEGLGATINYMKQRSDGRLPIVPPTGHGVSWCDADELERLCELWETRARAAGAIDWLRVGQLAESLSALTPLRDQARALDCWLAIGMQLIAGPFDWLGLREAVAGAVESPPTRTPSVAPDLLDQIAALEAAGAAASAANIQAARRLLDDLAPGLDDTTYTRLADRLSAVERQIKEAAA